LALLIDTDIAIRLRDGDRATAERLIAAGTRPSLSLISVIELEGGVHADPARAEQRRAGLSLLLGEVLVRPLDREVVQVYADILRVTGFSRRKILDRLIAATAICHDLSLATFNADDFRDIPGLRLEVWPSPQ
jgi:tRNA(fMet)-specific endonuclease VapC